MVGTPSPDNERTDTHIRGQFPCLMEDCDLVKTLQKKLFCRIWCKNSPHFLGMNLNANRSSPHLSTNGVSSFSGKTRPSVIEGTVGVLTSLMQELQNNDKTDSELWKNCETRWLQLFDLVEKQCEEQIVAQQEQFHSQIQRIQEEIKNLVKLQTNNASWACDSSLSRQTPAGGQMGFFPDSEERNEAAIPYPKSVESEMQHETPTSRPDCSADGSSVSSGYGTCCISELNTYKSKDSGQFMEHEVALAGPCGTSADQADPCEPCSDCGSSKSCGPQTAQDLCEHASLLPGELEHDFLGKSKISEVYSGKKNSSKAITSWAQKLKQNQPKRVYSEEGCSNSVRASEQASNWPPEKSDPTAAAQPSAFYLNAPEEVPDSWTSDSGTGLLYWKLEEKDLYHSLPETLRRALSPPAAQPPCQFNASSEMKLPSLKDIYHKKQRENKQFPERDLTSASHPNHPAEVLTLDPTVHRKPSPHTAAALPQGFPSALEDRVSFSPDSVLGPTLSSHCDMDSFSQASRFTSQLSGFPKSPPSKASPGDPWENHAFQNGGRTSSTFASMYATLSSDTSVNAGEEGTAGTVPPVSVPATGSSSPECVSSASPGYPVLLSQVRQSLKEKHARHIADLRAYYESEISSLKQKLEAKEICAVESWKKTNQTLIDRCDQLDGALSEATSRVRSLESKNNLLEIEVSGLRERFCAASNASTILQERMEEMRASNKEKDGTIQRLKARLQGVEEAFENAYRLSDDTEARLKQESKMFRDLLLEYESLGKEHERVKETLNTAENKLLDAHTQISELKRTVSKLEAQVKQVEHENRLGLRHLRAPRSSRADTLATSDVSRRKWLIPGAKYSIFTGQPLAFQDRAAENPPEKTCDPGCCSPLSDSPPGSPPVADPRDASDAPIMKALKQLEEEKLLKNWGTQTEGAPNKSVNSHLTGTSAGASRPPEKCTQQRQKRFNPASQRSSSLPPSSRKSSTPTRREMMLTPVTATYSPKRSPKENLSPGFSHLLSKDGNGAARSDILLDDLDPARVATAPHASPRRRLQFLPPADAEDPQCSGAAAHLPAPAHGSPPEPLPAAVKQGPGGPSEKQAASPGQAPPAAAAPVGGDFEYTAKIRTLAETERFFDELTKEKDQIEAALSRMPSAGGRITLQTRLNQEALEDRLERVNRELGSVRMTLKKFHVLRTCANL